MASSKLHRRMALRRKLVILRTLTKSKSVKKSSIIMDAFLYVSKLKLQAEAIKRECHNLINHTQEVKVEKIGTEGHLGVRITCKKDGELMLVSILEAFEEMNLNVVQARVCSDYFFGMEAIVQAPHDMNIDEGILNEVLVKVVQSQNWNKWT